MKKKLIVTGFLHLLLLLILLIDFTCIQPTDTESQGDKDKYIIYGDIEKTVTSFSRVEAVVIGNNSIDTFPKIVELWFNANTNGFSGNIYLSHTSDVNNYSAYVNLYSVDLKFIGRSDTVPFNSNASMIEIPAVDPMSAVPDVFAGNDTALSINDSIRLEPNAIDLFGGTIESWEWDVGNTGSFHSVFNGDTMIFLSSIPDSNYACIVKVMDNDSNSEVDTTIISVLKDDPKPTASAIASSVTINDTILFLGTATDSYGEIVKWEWDAGNTGDFVETTPDSNYTSIAPSTADANYQSVLRVTDDDGNIVCDTVAINVVVDTPVPTASTTTPKVSINDTIEYQGTATDLGRIVKWEWDVGNTGTFIETTPDSSYTTVAPPTPHNPYRTILRVTDDDSITAIAAVNIHVELDSPVPRASTTTPEVFIGDTIKLFGTATDGYGRIVKWEWDAGNTGNFVETTPDSNLTSIVPVGAGSNYQCILMVTDDDSNVSITTVKIRVTLFSSSPNIITTDADGAYGVYAIDIDGDTDIDVLSASSYGDSKIAWYENDGNQQFTPHTITTSTDRSTSVYAIDVDGDTDIDVLSASMGDDKIAWYENDGAQNFTDDTITLSADGAYSVFAIDIDGDADIDVLSASVNDNKIAWYENDGNQQFTEHAISTDAFGANSVFAIDLDGDTDIDVLSASGDDDRLEWYENDGSENFTTYTIAMSADCPYSVFAIDIDGDTDIDVLSASVIDRKIAWYENDGLENYTAHTITTSADCAYSVFAIDLVGDGDIDVLSASANDDAIAWYENDGLENFTPDTITTTADGARAVFAVDIDGDGDIDVLSASCWDNKIAWYMNLAK